MAIGYQAIRNTRIIAAEKILEASKNTRPLKLDDVLISGILRRKTGISLYHTRTVYTPNVPWDARWLAELEEKEENEARIKAQKDAKLDYVKKHFINSFN